MRAENLTKTLPTSDGMLTILDNVSLEVAPGESMSIIGESGSGKTTLLGLLAGLDLPTKGKVWLAGEELTQLDEDNRAKVRGEVVGFVFQSFQLIESLTALENVMLPGELRNERTATKDATRWLDQVGMAKRLKHYPRQLSGGEQQRVAIARAFASNPTVLFADEPTGNLDTATGTKIVDLLFELNERSRTTLMLVTHDKGLASRCDRTISLAGGKVVA